MSKFLCLFTVILGFSGQVWAGDAASYLIENFQRFPAGKLTMDGWQTRGGSASGIYEVKVDEGGNHFLSASDEGRSVQLFRKRDGTFRSILFFHGNGA